MEKFTIESLKVEGFRGFNSEANLNFDRNLALLFGANGRGKSSALGAIEWCLFGNLAFVHYEETPRAKDELVNAFRGKIVVELKLKRNGEQYVFKRDKDEGSEFSRLMIYSPSGEEFEFKDTREGDTKAKEKVFSILNLTFDDFYRSVYLHQESIRGLLTDRPEERNKAFDRLFGLETPRNILDNIPLAKVKKEVGDLDAKRQAVERQIAGRLEEAKRRLREKERVAKGLGLTEEDLDLDHGKTLSKGIADDLGAIAREAGVKELELPVPSSVSDLASLCSSVDRYSSVIRTQSVETKKMEEITKKKGEILGLKNDFDQQDQATKGLEKEISEIEAKYGDIEKIGSSIEGLQKEIEGFNKQRQDLNAKLRVVNDAIDFFDKAPSTDICPVCGAEIRREELLEHLRAELQEYGTEEIERIDSAIKRVEADEEALTQAQDGLKRLKASQGAEKTKLDELVRKIHKEIKDKPSPKEITAYLSEEMRKLDQEIKDMGAPLKKRETNLAKIAEKVKKIEALEAVLAEKERYKKLDSVGRSEGLNNLRASIGELAELQKSLTDVEDAIKGVLRSSASTMIERSEKDISAFYKQLCNHPYYSDFKIWVEPKAKGNRYHIKGVNPEDARETLASGRFSTGQMNCVALSIYLALSKVEVYAHNLGFLILDDPSQSLDPEHKEVLVGILRETAPAKQLLIATQDTEFQELLTKGLFSPEKAKIYRFVKWDEEGPQIEER